MEYLDRAWCSENEAGRNIPEVAFVGDEPGEPVLTFVSKISGWAEA